MGEKMPSVSKIAYRIRDSKTNGVPRLMYLHGAMGMKEIWLPLSRQVSDSGPDRGGWLLDLPGHGESEGAGCASISAFAERVHDFIVEHDLRDLILVGHSMGGGIAQQIALNWPERVRALVLLASGARLGVTGQIFSAIEQDYDMAIGMMQAFLFSPEFSKEEADAYTDTIRKTSPTVALEDFRACDKFSTVDRLHEVKVPALVCSGKQDLLTSPKKNRQLADSIGAKHIEMDNTGHMILVERVPELTEIISEFLSTVE